MSSRGRLRWAVKSTFPSPQVIHLLTSFYCLLWEIAKKRTRNTLRGHTDTITGPDFSPDGRFLVSCSYDRTVRIWRMRDGFSKLLEDTDASVFLCVEFNPDGRHIAAGDVYGMLKIWNVRTCQMEKWTAHGKVVHSVAFTPDGKGLVSSSADDTWKYWDVSLLGLVEPEYGMAKDTAGPISKVTAHMVRHSHVPVQRFLLIQVIPPFTCFCLQNGVISTAISPDGQWVVSGSADKTVYISDLRNAALQCTLKGHTGRVWSVVDFCPIRNYLASGINDGQVALWRYEAA